MKSKRLNPQTEVDMFNALVSVGDPVDYYEVLGDGKPQRFATQTPAEVLGGHSAVVWLNGKRGCVMVSHCLPAKL